MGHMSIALGLYSVYRELQKDFAATLREVKKLGYDGVEFFGELSHDPAEVREVLEKNDLQNCGWHTEWKLLQKETLPGTLEYHRIAGTPNIIVPALGGPWEIAHTRAEDCAEIWMEHAAELNELSDKVQEQGFRLGYHTHAHEFDTDFGGVTPWDILSKHTGQDIILELDTGNSIEGGKNPADILPTIMGRPVLVHCKPYSLTAGLETYIGKEDDANDWPENLKKCKEAGTEWLIVEHESDSLYPQFMGARKCLEGIKRFLR
jgi:sugar phosphate isomerase/epimerase